jgi:hypothetical protein
VSPTLNVNLPYFPFLIFLLGLYGFTIILLLSLTIVSVFSFKIQSSMTTFHYINVKMQNILNSISRIVMNFLNFQSSMNHSPRNFIHKKCHRKSYDKWHKITMTINTILGVPTCTIIWTSWWTVVWKWLKPQWRCRWYADQILKHLTCTHGWCMRVLGHVLSISVCTGISSVFCNL